MQQYSIQQKAADSEERCLGCEMFQMLVEKECKKSKTQILLVLAAVRGLGLLYLGKEFYCGYCHEMKGKT
jgi:hypothetical protein